MNSLSSPFRAIIIGSSGGVGRALVSHLEAEPRCAEVVALSRGSNPAVELTNEASIAVAAANLAARAPFHLIVDATGVLHDAEGMSPEKSLRAVAPETMARAFAVNAIGPILLMKHLSPLLPREGKSVFATLSARVGSIGDNGLGGWYSYRASKAALNMLWKTASIEVGRQHKEAVCLALHPGTVETALSDPFAGKRQRLSPQESANMLLAVMDARDATSTGGFFDYANLEIVW